MRRNDIVFWTGAAVFLLAILLATLLVRNEYPFFAGYVNFGTNAFFGVGVYTAVLLFKALGAPLGVQIVAAAAVGSLLGFGVGLYACAVLGMVLVRLTGSSALLWLLVPSFLLVGIGGDRKLWQKTDTALVQDSIDTIWFAPNS